MGHFGSGECKFVRQLRLIMTCRPDRTQWWLCDRGESGDMRVRIWSRSSGQGDVREGVRSGLCHTRGHECRHKAKRCFHPPKLYPPFSVGKCIHTVPTVHCTAIHAGPSPPTPLCPHTTASANAHSLPIAPCPVAGPGADCRPRDWTRVRQMPNLFFQRQ